MAMISFCALLPLVAGVGSAQQRGPDLYKDDSPPRGALGFKPIYPKHPPPAPADWEQDLLDDDDSDGGFWDAQMTYDRLRASHSKREEQVKEALALSEKMEKEVAEAKKKQTESHKEVLDSKAAAEKLEEQMDELNGDVKVAKKKLELAKDAVKEDAEKLKEVKQAIEDTKKKMKKLADYKKKNAKKAKKADRKQGGGVCRG